MRVTGQGRDARKRRRRQERRQIDSVKEAMRTLSLQDLSKACWSFGNHELLETTPLNPSANPVQSMMQASYQVSLFFSLASLSYFSSVLLSTMPVKYLEKRHVTLTCNKEGTYQKKKVSLGTQALHTFIDYCNQELMEV